MVRTKGDHQKAWRIRKKVEKGTATPGDLEWMAEYEKSGPTPIDEPEPKDDDTATPADAPPSATPEAPPVQSAPPPAPESPGGAGGTLPPPAAPPPPKVKVKAPPLPRIPDVEIDEPKSKEKDSPAKWQDKYKGSAAGQADFGREAVCQMMAKPWLDLLMHMDKEMKECGLQTVIDPEALWPSMILTADGFLPTGFKISPPMVVALGSTVILGQRFVQRKAIKTALDKRRAESQHVDQLAEMRKRQEREREQAETARVARVAAQAMEAIKNAEASPTPTVQIVKDTAPSPAPKLDVDNPDSVF